MICPSNLHNRVCRYYEGFFKPAPPPELSWSLEGVPWSLVGSLPVRCSKGTYSAPPFPPALVVRVQIPQQSQSPPILAKHAATPLHVVRLRPSYTSYTFCVDSYTFCVEP